MVKVRDNEEEFAKTVIQKYNDKENVEITNDHNNIFKNEVKKVYRKTLKVHSTNLSKLIQKQNSIISEAALSKKVEVYFEASPQTILQLYIIAITNEISTSQIVTICVSVLVTTFGTMSTYLKEPTKVVINL